MNYKVAFISDIDNTELYSELLQKGVEIGFYSFWKQATRLTCCHADLVVLDCGFEFERGLSILMELKACCPEILIVFLTAEGSERTAVEAFRAGAREYFHKPVNLFELQETIDGLLGLKGSTRERRSRLRHSGASKKEKTFASTTTDKPLNMLRVVRYIEEHLAGNVTLQDLADTSRLSKYHFCRSFNKHFGLSPMTYLTSLRVQRAKELLSRDNITVSTIAFELGYDSPGSLIRNFKKNTGFTPNGYREHVRQKAAEV